MTDRRAAVPEALGLVMPEDLRQAGDMAGNGEWFWSAGGAIEAASWLAERNMAIIGGEIYHRHDRAWGSYLAGWATDPEWRPGREAWHDFIERGLQTTRQVVQSDLAGQVAQERGDVHLFFLAYTSKTEWRAAQHRAHPGT